MDRDSVYQQTVSFLVSVHGLPLIAAQALARKTMAESIVWNRLASAAHTIDGDSDGLPDLFSGATGQELINGLISFCWAYGSRRVYVPHSIEAGHPFHTAAGPAAAAHLAATFGGLPLIVPTVTSLARVIRNQAIREEYRAGKSLNELAEEYGLAYPWVIAILRGEDAPKPEPKPDNQPKLTF
jgi:hypothetical protein